jgi:hypothetical protein
MMGKNHSISPVISYQADRQDPGVQNASVASRLTVCLMVGNESAVMAR